MIPEIKFTPKKSLLDFAEWFSLNYKKLPAGHYHSDPIGYSVKYLNRIKNEEGSIQATLSRVSNKTRVIEIDRTEFRKNKKLTENYVFYSIVWCVVKVRLQEDWGIESYFEADRITTDYYIRSQPARSREDILIGWLVQLKRSSGASHNIKERVDAVKKQLLKAKEEDEKMARKLLKLKSKKKNPLNHEIRQRAFSANNRKGNRKRQK